MTILSASPGNGRCNALASSHGARIQTSRSSSVVRITGMAFEWTARIFEVVRTALQPRIQTGMLDPIQSLRKAHTMTSSTERAVLAGGCFWGVQDLIRKMPGVISTRVGYSGSDVANTTYEHHGTHAEDPVPMLPRGGSEVLLFHVND